MVSCTGITSIGSFLCGVLHWYHKHRVFSLWCLAHKNFGITSIGSSLWYGTLRLWYHAHRVFSVVFCTQKLWYHTHRVFSVIGHTQTLVSHAWGVLCDVLHTKTLLSNCHAHRVFPLIPCTQRLWYHAHMILSIVHMESLISHTQQILLHHIQSLF